MAELEKEIIGKWFEIKTNIENLVNLREYFNLSAEELKNISSKLHSSIEEGIIEYKKEIMKAAFSLAEALKYDTSSLNMIKDISSDLNSMVYIILIQRLIAKKIIRLKSRSTPDNDDQEKNSESKEYKISEISDIFKEVQGYVQENPGLKSNKNIINIFIQVNKYKKELETMKKLLPNIPADKKENFGVNYTAIFNDIFSKLLNSYRLFCSEFNTAAGPVKNTSHPLDQYDLTVTSELLKNQAETAVRIQTTFAFADKERFKILEHVQSILQLENKFTGFIEKETLHYYNASLSEKGKRELSRMLCLEIIKILDRQAESAE